MCRFLHPINILARARARERIASPLSPPSLPLLIALSISPIPLASLCGCARSASLKNHIFLCVLFYCFFTQATRYFLIILLIDTSFSTLLSPSAVSFPIGKRAISPIDNNRYQLLHLVFPLSFSFSLLENRRYLLASSTLALSAARGKSTVRYLPGYIFIYIYSSPSSCPTLSPHSPPIPPFLHVSHSRYYLYTSS